jgi:hypothetical protein
VVIAKNLFMVQYSRTTDSERLCVSNVIFYKSSIFFERFAILVPTKQKFNKPHETIMKSSKTLCTYINVFIFTNCILN